MPGVGSRTMRRARLQIRGAPGAGPAAAIMPASAGRQSGTGQEMPENGRQAAGGVRHEAGRAYPQAHPVTAANLLGVCEIWRSTACRTMRKSRRRPGGLAPGQYAPYSGTEGAPHPLMLSGSSGGCPRSGPPGGLCGGDRESGACRRARPSRIPNIYGPAAGAGAWILRGSYGGKEPDGSPRVG